jgi:hypothetical protein
MTLPSDFRNIGEEVVVLTERGDYLTRGTIRGVHRTTPAMYDVDPRGATSLKQRLHCVAEQRIRNVRREYLAYERKPSGPKHIVGEA